MSRFLKYHILPYRTFFWVGHFNPCMRQMVCLEMLISAPYGTGVGPEVSSHFNVCSVHLSVIVQVGYFSPACIKSRIQSSLILKWGMSWIWSVYTWLCTSQLKARPRLVLKEGRTWTAHFYRTPHLVTDGASMNFNVPPHTLLGYNWHIFLVAFMLNFTISYQARRDS